VSQSRLFSLPGVTTTIVVRRLRSALEEETLENGFELQHATMYDEQRSIFAKHF